MYVTMLQLPLFTAIFICDHFVLYFHIFLSWQVYSFYNTDFVLLGLLFVGQKYDEAKEAQALLEKKQKQLNRVESLKLAEDAAG